MVMSGNTILAPREDSDPAIDGAARSAAGGRVVRYWTWVRDHRGQCRTAGGPYCDATGHGGRLLHARHRTPAAGLEPHQRRDLHAESVAGRTVPSGGIFHYLDGIVFTVVFVVAVYPPLRRRSATFGNALKGPVFWGTILATLSCAFMIPRVYFPRCPRRILQPQPRL